MAETMKERKDMDPQYMWDLSTLFKMMKNGITHYLKLMK